MVAVHVFSVVYAVVLVLIADEYALSWLLGRKELLSAKILHRIHVLTWIGLLSLIASGLWIALPRLDYLLQQPLFIMKMLFVWTLVVNAILIGRLNHLATERAFGSLSTEEKMPLFVSGAVSAFSWAGAVILALVVFG